MGQKEKLKAVIVDDEEMARDLLSDLLSQFCSEIEVIGAFSGLPEAESKIKQLKPDIVFLDIEMPNFSGLEVRKFFPESDADFEIIFITAYERYALRAFEVAAMDYLLKPIDVDRLQDAVKRISSRKQTAAAERYALLKETIDSQEVKRITVFVKGEHRIVDVETIAAIQADDAYSSIHTVSGDAFLVTKTLKHFDDILADNPNFFRCHKSWLINLDLIEGFVRSKGEIQLKNGLTAKFSKYRKEALEKALNSF